MSIEIKEAKSLRWLANQFPYTKEPKNETDKLSNAIHIYATEGAEKIETQETLIDALNEVVKRITIEYLAICENECTGDSSVGIPSCPFYHWPDVTDDNRPCRGGCELKGTWQ